ncbi:hypothetical protein CAI21_05495 [Alkalilimnicola ehrlichii]|uniref:Gonadoliberin III n=1 Tax=Alkalilimnicola ehrlichii TaxID=351052 RepID=A0A3E0WYI8_9GAMM|nr:inactive transglutaminase family protein [Alkalilimnicola ehrlichii]RFA30502.1 hypothetical protein CAI21_05495 [Alkalilimnicola ehrlichii]RFA38052.1 hypothetical protein CAL65_06865 [Alkalilimnicola ehrlichii]
MKDLHLRLLAFVLAAAGLGLCYYKVTALGLPLQPITEAEVWTVEARIGFHADGGPAQVQFYLPNQPPGFTVLGENFVSGSYGLATDFAGDNREARWSVRRANGRQVLYYRIQLAEATSMSLPRSEPIPAYPQVPNYSEPYRSAVMSVLDGVRAQSADISTFTRQFLVRFNAANPDKDIRVLREGIRDDVHRVRRIQRILAGARIPSRTVYILRLQDGMRQGTLEPWLEVHNEREWLPFDPQTGRPGYPPNALVWRVGDDPLAEVVGGSQAEISFSTMKSIREVLGVAEERARLLDSRVLEFSLFSLPVSTQNMYRVLLLVPIGAFLVVLLRNIVGIKTFGTFMPILIALAFRETALLWGVFYFILLVGLGLAIRFYLETLKLLLVPRLSAVLIVVILLMAGTSLVSHKLGLVHGVSIALFPMVILAMTIERMSLVWEEQGAKEALQQGVGSLLVAIAGYLVMTNEQVAYLVFVFPELILVLLAMTLLLGRYSGYRLTELWRFRAMLRSAD